ncbi:neutral zinc metallopeptidase [Caulobacter sp. DWP3-1-3b2]|uniref:neutral zinc metallopeptidase n=1 Tax=Caulobacter sp. DWP3-1-3b2 TaxID=2804643 RepID=UPI003CEDDFA9
MDQRKALKSAGLALLLVLVTLPPAAGTSEGEASVLARKVLDSTTIEWSQPFSARGSAYRAPKVMFNRLPRLHPARGAGYSPGELVTLDLGELEETRAIFPRDGNALAALMIAHEVAHHVQFLEMREGR